MKTKMLSTNGTRMNVVEAGKGRPLVFLHGLGWDHEMWLPFMTEFSGRYRVIAGDTRGHGSSDKPPGPYSIQMFSDDWHGALQSLGVKDACIIGFSQGGMIAQMLAVQHPEDVGALLLACTTCRSSPDAKQILEDRIREARSNGAEAAARLAAKSVFSPAFIAAHPERLETFVSWRAAMDQAAIAEATRAAYGFDVASALRSIDVPVKVVYGECDQLTKPQLVKNLAEALPEGTELVGVPEAGHMVPIEQPRRFEEIVSTFLDKYYPCD
jgi:pimeloyl-ACP methyl ester carboxylesterase